jgi:hypothetical protein
MSSLVRVALLLVLGIVLLGRGLVYLNDRLASAEHQPDAAPPSAPSAAPAVPPAAATAVPAPLPPPTDTQLLSLGMSRGDDLVYTLKELQHRAVTPELLHDLDATAAREPYPEIQRFVACHKARADGAPLSQAFDALPTDPDDVDWHHDAAACLVVVIAARAEEDRDRAIPILARRAIDNGASISSPVVDALRRLDLAELPAVIAETADNPSRRYARVKAVEAAIALGAADKWPDRVDAWLRDDYLDGYVRQGLANRTDPASMTFLAREITASPRDESLLGIAGRFAMKPGTLDLSLAAIAADPQAPSFARAHAAYLVGLYGGPEAAKRLGPVSSDDPTVRAALDTAFTTLDRRLGPSARAAASR